MPSILRDTLVFPSDLAILITFPFSSITSVAIITSTSPKAFCLHSAVSNLQSWVHFRTPPVNATLTSWHCLSFKLFPSHSSPLSIMLLPHKPASWEHSRIVELRKLYPIHSGIYPFAMLFNDNSPDNLF